jgi:hypothetical protein
MHDRTGDERLSRHTIYNSSSEMCRPAISDVANPSPGRSCPDPLVTLVHGRMRFRLGAVADRAPARDASGERPHDHLVGDRIGNRRYDQDLSAFPVGETGCGSESGVDRFYNVSASPLGVQKTLTSVMQFPARIDVLSPGGHDNRWTSTRSRTCSDTSSGDVERG